MISKEKFIEIRQKTLSMLENAKIALTEADKQDIEVADFGLNDVENTGLQLITYINTERVCAKELVLLPRQTCPEHRHPDVNGKQGKEETFRCRAGEVFIYVEGDKNENPSCTMPKDAENYTVWHEIKLLPGEQYTLYPNTLHWFQAGDNGAIVSEFSTKSTDENDIFTNKRIKRAPEVREQ